MKVAKIIPAIECIYMEGPMEATKTKTTIEGMKAPKLKPPLNMTYGGD